VATPHGGLSLGALPSHPHRHFAVLAEPRLFAGKPHPREFDDRERLARRAVPELGGE